MRKRIKIDEDWLFWKTPESEPEHICLPHTWNALDGQDGGNDYYRGVCRYEKKLDFPALRQGESVYVEFEGVSSIADVWINGKKVARHEGGFSTFRADLTEHLTGNDTLIVLADNRKTPEVYPQFADFTFFGGIYRDVSLCIVPGSHFTMDDCGGPGVRVRTSVREGCGIVNLEARVDGPAEGMQVEAAVIDRENQIAAKAVFFAEDVRGSITVDSPHLWDGIRDPYLYRVVLTLTHDGQTIDEISVSAGFRTMRVDPEQGFFLNGRPYPLRGVARHQDRLDKGWAISREDQDEDMSLIREVGANSIRLAHYQHSQYFYDLCDRYGMVVWAEIPYISNHMPAGRGNTVSQMTELIVQNMHHACVACWGISNEITMYGLSEDCVENHRVLQQLCRRLDDTRPTAMACLSTVASDCPLLDIPDLISYNHYFGWYVENAENNGPWFDDFRRKRPDLCLGESEYGSEGLMTKHSEQPVRGDYSEEYQVLCHKAILDSIVRRPYLWSTYAWNMFDFAADNRDEGGVRGRNNKGLVSFDRKQKKDSFYLYKAYWSETPFVWIGGKRYAERNAEQTVICVYSNQPEVSLYVDGALLSRQKADKVFAFQVSLKRDGPTEITAVAGQLSDRAEFRYVSVPDASYRLPGGPQKLSNWFERTSRNVTFDAPDGKYSVWETIEQIRSEPQGRKLLAPFIQKISTDLCVPADYYLELVRDKSVMEIVSIVCGYAHTVVQDAVVLNRELNQISK